MARYAVVQNGVVANVAEADAATARSLGWIEAGEAQIGWPVVGGVPVAPTLAVEARRAARLQELAAYRYALETGGITVGGADIDTDRPSQALVNGAYSYSLLNPSVLIDWKTASGAWVRIDAATIAGIASAVAAHVQACFSAERAHADALAALETAEAVDDYDLSTGWG